MYSPSKLDFLFGKSVSSALPRLLGIHGKQRLAILIYHRVLPCKDELLSGTPHATEFDWQMGVLSRFCHPLSLAEALSRMDAGTLPERAVCVTFDDGYADNATVALPILQKWSVPATVFVASGFLNGGRMWNDTVVESVRALAGKELDLRDIGLEQHALSSLEAQRRTISSILMAIKYRTGAEREKAVASIAAQAGALPNDLMMSDEQVTELSRHGIEIGGHTVNHPILATLSADQSWNEIKENKTYLETLIGQQLRFFAYPNGRLGKDYSPEHCDMVRKAGYSAALSTHRGVVSADADRLQLARFTPWDKTPQRFLARLLLNGRQLVLSPNPQTQ